MPSSVRGDENMPADYDHLDGTSTPKAQHQSPARTHRDGASPSPTRSRPEREDKDSEKNTTPKDTGTDDTIFQNLDELAASPPDAANERHSHRSSLEAQRSHPQRAHEGPNPLVQLYTYSWLIFFSLLGTLARLGIQWLTDYPNAVTTTAALWANVSGCFVLGFLMEDRVLFAPRRDREGLGMKSSDEEKDDEVARIQRDLRRRNALDAHLKVKKTLPLYIGLSVGFCGSCTSFSSFMRDAFLALSNDLFVRGSRPIPRNDAWSVCAVLGVFIVEIGLSMTAFIAGAHFSELVAPVLIRLLGGGGGGRYLDPLGVLLGLGCWLGAVFLAIWPPQDRWRQDCVFALVFAPLGCMLRFVLAMRLNGKVAAFPMGTFAANAFGCLVLAMAYDLQMAPLGGVVGGGLVGCQVLQGVIDGFCGTLSTVSTWIAELKSLRKRHAYVYGLISVGVGFCLMLVVIGPLRWTRGFSPILCSL